MGTMRVCLKGEPPKDLLVVASENFSEVTEENATWTFRNSTIFHLSPRDQKIQNPRKQTDKDARKFQKIYFLFITGIEDSKFYVQVTFPDEEDLERRRNAASDQIA